jgi:regulator of protease activity HflC (stomatin/prohibitin superfamily)
MKKIMFFLSVCLVAISFSSCSLVSVDGDEVAVFNKKPWLFGSGGVSKEVLTEGSTWKVFTTDVIKFKDVPVKYTIEFGDLMTDDNTPIDSKAHIFLEVIGDQANVLYGNYGADWYDNNIQEKFSKSVRDKLSQYAMYDLTSNREVYDKIEPEIVSIMTTYISELSKEKLFPVRVKNVIVDRAEPGNPEVANQVNQTAAQIQAKQTFIKQQDTEKEREKSEKLRAIADKAYQKEMGFTTREYLADKQLSIMEKNGSKFNVIVGGNAQAIFDPTK